MNVRLKRNNIIFLLYTNHVIAILLIGFLLLSVSYISSYNMSVSRHHIRECIFYFVTSLQQSCKHSMNIYSNIFTSHPLRCIENIHNIVHIILIWISIDFTDVVVWYNGSTYFSAIRCSIHTTFQTWQMKYWHMPVALKSKTMTTPLFSIY